MLGWIKSATDNFSTALTRNLRNPRDYAPLTSISRKEESKCLQSFLIQGEKYK